MASLIERSGRRWQIRWKKGKKRIELNVPPMDRAEANRARRHIEHMIQQNKDKLPFERVTRDWLDGISDKLHGRLANKGLVPHRFRDECRTMKGLCSHFIAWKNESCEPSTLEVYLKTTRMLIAYFTPNRDISTLSPSDIDDFLAWVYAKGRLVNGKYAARLAATTASRRCQIAKSIFRRAARKRWIETGSFYEMFEDMRPQVRTNPDRQHRVSAEVVRLAIEHAMSNEQKLIFALARWGGLRIPSELLQIMWADIDRENEKIEIRSRKNKRHVGKLLRSIPLWPEIRTYLDIAYEEARDGQEYVIARHRSENTSAHRNLFLKSCKRAGITKVSGESPWPKLWINMRSTRETELLEAKYPAEAVFYWMNHSEKVSKQHYQQWQSFEWRK